MFARTFKSFFRGSKKQPIVNAHKVPKARKRVHLGLELLEDRVTPANFTTGNLAVIDLAAASTNTTGSILELNPFTANQASPIQTVSIPSSGTNALRFSNSGTSSFLSHSNDGTLLTIGGYNTTDSSTADLANTTTSDRAVVTLNNSTTVNIATTYTGISGNQDRSATTTDDSSYYITDKGGLYSNGETAPTSTLNVLVAKSFGGTAYVATTRTAAQGNTFGSAILTAASPTATTFTGLSANIPIDVNIQDFYLIQSGNNGTTYDTLYTLDGASGQINKFSLTGGTWTARGSYTLTGGALGLAAAPNGTTGAFLYVTTGAGAVGNSVVELTDTAAYNSNISVTTANNVTLFTATGASAGELKGIDFVPVAGAAATGTTTDAPTVTPTGSQPFGTNETFTAIVHASTGSTAPTAGTVTFESGSTVLATATSETTSGTAATFTVSSTSVPIGSYNNITAVYSPGAGFSGSTSSASGSTLTITGTATTTAAPTFTPATATVNSPVSFTAVVSASSGSTAPTAGTVTFMSGSTVLATAASETTSGTQATFTVSSNSIPVGTYSNITAVYSGNGAFTTSTSSASGTSLTVNPVQAPSGAIAQWTFENDPIALNNSPAPSTGTGAASAIGMTNSFNGTTSTNTDDVLQGVSGDTGTNTLADTTQIWRVRGQTPGNGWSSQAPIGTQGAVFATSTVNHTGPITVTFDWYATTAGEANLQLEYTTDGATWHNVAVTVPSGDADVAALTNSSSSNTVNGSYIQMSGGQQWAQGLTAIISDPAAVNDPNFAIEMVNASTGADDIAAGGGALNNTSGNWRFDNITITAPVTNFTPGNLVVLQAGDGTNQYNAQAPLFLNEITTSGTSVQQVAIPAIGGVGNAANQPITIDLSAAAGNGQLTRSYDGSALSFDGIDSTINNGGLTAPATPTGQDNRVVAVVTGNPNIPSNINTTTDGAFYVGDDNRGSVAESPTGPIYTAGHPNQAGGAVSQGVHEFDAEGPSIGTQVSASTNIRGVNIGFDNRMYFSTASGLGGSAALNTAGIFTEAQALPTSSTPTPANDIMVVPAIFGASKLGGLYLADMNGDGVLDNGDRLYFVDDGTVGGAGTGGLYVATWNGGNDYNPWNTPTAEAITAASWASGVATITANNDFSVGQTVAVAGIGGATGYNGSFTITGVIGSPGNQTGFTYALTTQPTGTPTFTGATATLQLNAASVAAGILNHWSAPVRLGDAPTQAGSGNVGQLRGLTGTVISPTEADLYTTANDGAANDSSVIQQWQDVNTGASIVSASESGTTVTVATAFPNAFTNGEVVQVDGVGANNGAGAISSGYNGAWTITVVDSTHFTYTDTNAGASNLATVINQGAANGAIQTDASQAGTFSNFGIGTGAGNTLGGTIIDVLASGTDTIGGKSFGDVGLRGVAFAPVAATGVTLSQSPANPLTPGSAVTLTATLTNSQVTPSGQVAFIDQNTNTVLGFGTISTTGGVTTASLTLPTGVIGNHFVKAYFGGGGAVDLASANSNTIQVIEAGNTASTTTVASNLPAAATGKQVTLTATVATGATGTVSFFNGSVALANLLGTATINGTTATLTAAFGTAGTQTINAVYNGDNTFASSQGATTVNVAANATATITTSANNVALNATPTYTATIVGNATLGVPAGTVTFTIVSATTNTSGAPLVKTSSTAMTLTPGSGNTATATWTSPALSAPGSYFVTISYSATGATNPYSNFAIATANASNGVTLIETVQKAFTPGNLVAVQRGDGTVNLGSSAYPVVLVEYARTGGAEVQAIVLPDADSGSTHALFLSGQNGSEGLLNRSANGADLTISGYDLPAGHTFVTSTFPFQFPRTIAEVNAAGLIDTSTAISTTQVGITAASETGTTVTITAATVAGLSVGEKVVISGVTPSGYNGQFTITGINAGASTFTYTAASGLGTAMVSSAFATSSSVPYNPLDVVSYDGQQFWLASNLPVGDTTDNGIDFVGNVGATTATQIGNGNNSAAALSIAGGQLYVTTGKNVQTLGTGLPTTPGQSLTGLPNLATVYQSFFPNTESPEQVLLLNTNDGTTNNPNVAYIADQANGLLKFYLSSASISTLSESGTTVTVTTAAANTFTTGDQVQIAGASVAGYNGTFTITVTDSTHFTYTLTATGLASATGGTASEWLYGKNGTGVFGQKLVFSGGATGVTGYVVNPGASAQVQLYITGSNVTQANPNQIDSLLDTNTASQGFPSGSFTNLGFVGGASAGGSFNGNENFAGLAFVPGAVTTTIVTSAAGKTTYGTNVTFTATVTSPVDTPTGTVSFYDGITLLGTGTISTVGSNQVATLTTTNYLSVGHHTISAVFNPGGASLATDDVSIGSFNQEIDYDPPAVDLVTAQVGFSSPIASMSVSGNTVTVTTSEYLPFALNATGLNLTITGNSGTNVNGSFPITLLSQNSFSYTSAGATAGTSGTVSLASSVNISTVSVSGSTVTVTTSASSGFLAGQSVTIAGNSGTNINGTFILTSVSGTTLKYTSSGAVTGTGGTATGTTALTGSATATYLNDSTVYQIAASSGVTVSGSTVTVTTNGTSTDFQVGEEVTIAGTTGGTNINGTFAITGVSGATFTYTSTGAVAPASTTNSTATGWNANNTIYLPTAVSAATITGASWNVGTDLVTVTTSAAHNLQAGQLVTIAGVTPSGYNGSFVILSVPTSTTFTYGLLSDPGTYTSGGTAQVDQNAFTESGTSTTTSYITNSVDGHTLEIAGNDAAAGTSLSSAQSVVAVVGPDGSVNDSTLISSQVGSARAVISADGSGFWVATSTGLDFVPFGGATPSAISAASWSSANGGTATITAPNNYVVGQLVYVTGIGVATGYNTTSTNGYPNAFTVLSASPTQFTYALPTQPTGTPTFTNAISQLAPTLVSAAANNFGNGGQTPSTVTIGTDPNGNFPQLIADAGNQFQNNGEPSIDGPFTVGSGLPTTGGQPIGVYGTGANQNFPNARDRFQNFPSSAQFAVSPDGQTVFVADSRTDGLGGILEYNQAVSNSWVLLGSIQLDNYAITSATESGNTVTITTSGPSDFFVGESVAVNGVALPSYNGSGNIVTSVSGNTFTFTSSFSGLSSSGAGPTGAFATGADGGMRGLAADFTDNGANDGKAILYVTTSGTSGNRLEEITGGTLDSSNANFQAVNLGTAAPGTAFRGVAFAPARPGTTASTTSVSASGNVLSATVTSGATGWVEFFQGGNYIGTGLIKSGTATLDTTGVLPAGTYSVTATYTGNNTFAPSTGTTSLTVALISTSTSLSFNPTTASTGSPETITATITVPAGQNPTGLVTFTNTDASTVLGYATVNQVIQNVNSLPVITYQAVLTVPAGTFTAGTTHISASYAGTAFFAASTSPTTALNIVNSTTTTVTSNLVNPTAATGQSLTLSAAVTSTASGTPTGTVQFYDNTLALGGPVTLNGSGVATLTVNTTLVQSVTISSASANASGVVTITTDANNPMTVGETVVIEGITNNAFNGTFTVTGVSGNTFTYQGQFHSAATDVKGGLAIGLNVLTPGLHSISAVYTPASGSLFAGSTGVHEQTVQGQAIGATDVFVERLGDGITSLNTQSPNPALGSIGATNYIDEFTVAANGGTGTLVQSFILPSADSQAFSVSNATWSGGVATITTVSPNDFAVGQIVTVAGITGTTGASYNGDVVITAVSGNTFSYALATQPTGTPAFTGATATGVVHAVVGDGQQSTTGQMTLSGNGGSLFLTGYDNNPLPFGTALPLPSANGSQNVARSIARLNANGSIQTEGLSTSLAQNDNFNEFDGIYSPDGNQFYVTSGDAGFGPSGVFYFSSLAQSATLQGSVAGNEIASTGNVALVGLESFGGNLYGIGAGAGGNSSNPDIVQIGSGLPTTNVQSVTGAAWAGGTATLTLSSTTGFAIGSSVLVSGITGTTGTSYNGTVTLTGVTATTISYALATQPTGTPVTTGATASLLVSTTTLPGFPTTANQTEPIPISGGATDAYFTHLNGPGAALDTIYVGDRGKSFGLGAITKWTLTSVNISSITESGTTATVTLASAALGLVVGQPITITLAGNTPAAYNGTFSITPTSSTTFTFTAPTGTGNSTANGTASAFVEAPGGILYSQSTAQLGYYWLAGSTDPNTHAVTLYSTYGNGGNGDFGPGLTYQVLDTNGFNASPGVQITNATWSSGTVTITANNDFKAGNIVDVEGVSASGYNGQFTITSATPTSFTYAVSTNPGTATVTGAIATSVNTVNSVAFEGAGGGFLGSETTRGVALAPQFIGTTTILADNGPNPSVIGSTVSFVVTVSPTVPNGESVTLEDASNSNAVVGTGTLSGGTATISVSGLSIGTHNIFAVYGGDATDLGSQSAQVAQVVNPIQVSSVVVNGDYIPITGASLSGGIVTLTTDGNNGFTAGNQIVIAGYTGTSAGYNGTYTIQSASANQVTYADSNTGMPTLSFNGVGYAISANTTSSLNPGGPNGGHQRSMVDSIVYNFDTPVNLAGGAITLGLKTGVTVTGTATLSTAVPNETLTELNGGMTWVVTFSSATGNTVVGHSIADGVYTTNLNSADVTAVSGGSVMTTTRPTDTFYRLFGDENADHHVNSTDALQFANADGKNNGLTGYLAYFDENADGRINSTDALQFANRDSAFWSGFTPTI